MRHKSMLPRLFLIAMLSGLATIIVAAGTGRITGTVSDRATGQPIAGASVLVVGTNYVTTTEMDGRFVIDNIQPGKYTVRVSCAGYEDAEVRSVVVESELTFDLSVLLLKKVINQDSPVTVTEERIASDEFNISSQKMLLNGMSVRVDCVKLCAPSGEGRGFPPAHGGTAIVNGAPFDAMFFKNYGVNPFVDTEDDHLSTFAIDVDDASYVMTRSYIDRGHLPPDEAVRTEEFINHFDYGYKAPGDEAFSIFVEGAPSRFGQNCRLLKLGIKGQEVRPENRKAANLVFVIDVSGSMAREDRLGLVKKALRLMVDELQDGDRVGIVTYGSNGNIVLRPTPITDRDLIIRAIESLHSGGSTFAEEGLRFGYRMAEQSFENGKINRIILCSDGVANVGRTGADDILKEIRKYADMGITLSSIGFGMGNYNDILLEKLGNKGNGHYAYVDNLAEAKRVFVENLTGTLQVIARDVKIQVDFNPDVVRSYRLLGYENRDVDDDKFRDNKEDGGEIGSGHEVTALYEVKFVKDVPSSEVGTIYIRYKDPDNDKVTEVSRAIHHDLFKDSFERASVQFKLSAAAAEFAEILRKSYWAKESSLNDVLALVKEISNEIDSPDVIELMGLISKARQYDEQLARN